MKCNELMERDLHVCGPRDPVRRVAQLMRAHKIGFVPVCDGAGRVLGAITDRDLALRVVAEPGGEDLCAQDVMTRELVTCDPDDELARAEQLMATNQKHRVLCVLPDGRLVGVISLVDVATVEPGDAAARVLRAVASRDACFVFWQ